MRRIARCACLGLFCVPLASGCSTVPRLNALNQTSADAAAGVGYSYHSGHAIRTFSQPEPTVLEATLSAMEDLSMRPTREPKRNGTSTVINGHAADNRRVKVDLAPSGEDTTVSVQVGLFGDEPLSAALLDRLRIRLRELPPEAVPDELPSEPGSNPFISREAVSDSEMLRGFTDSGFEDTPTP